MIAPHVKRIERSTRRRRLKRKGTAGQSLTEYVIVLIMFIGIVFALAFFLSFFLGHGWRILHLIGLEYP